jgi:hypothetical protein
MAHQLIIPDLKIPGIPPVLYAVGEAVGARCPNRADDVELLQFIFRRLAELQGLTPDAFSAVGRWDKLLGFEVFQAQYGLKLPVVDGVVSVIFTRAQVMAKRSVLIFLLYNYFDLAPAEYSDLPNNTKLTAGLRRSLASITRWP